MIQNVTMESTSKYRTFGKCVLVSAWRLTTFVHIFYFFMSFNTFFIGFDTFFCKFCYFLCRLFSIAMPSCPRRYNHVHPTLCSQTIHSHIINLVKYNKLSKMLDTSTSVCHPIVHFLMLQNGYLDTSKAISDGNISKIIEHYYVTLMMTYKQSL